MQFTDSHIHLQDYKEKNAQQIIKKMTISGFSKAVCASSHPDDWSVIEDIYKMSRDFIVPAFGIHPWYINEVANDRIATLENLLNKYPQAIVGEIGLDNLKASNPSLQEFFFDTQLNLAKFFKRPVCIHTLRADNQIERRLSSMPDKFMIHSFGGSVDFMQKILNHEGYISLSPAILKKKNHIEIIKYLPLRRMLSESDAPYMSDFENIIDFLAYVAKIKNIDKLALINQIYQNFEEFCHVG